MSQADRIRSFIIRTFVEPARREGGAFLSVRAGDVHRMMGLSNMPRAVCSVLRGTKLRQEANLHLNRQEGPTDGMNVWFHYDLAQPLEETTKHATTSQSFDPVEARPVQNDSVDLCGALVLISRTKAKLTTPAPARDLYSSPAFQMKRRMAERDAADWLVLSAKHGIVRPNDIVEPYDETLTGMGISGRRAWADRVLPALVPVAKGYSHVVCLAGQNYIEFLVQPLTEAGIRVSLPLKGLRQGEQLSWMTKHQ